MTQDKLNGALFDAVRGGDLEKVKELLASGAQVDARDDDGWQPLHYAARGGHLPVVKYLIEEQGVQVDAKSTYGSQPLHFAAWHGHLPVVKYLVGERGAQVDAKDGYGRQPLHHAADDGHLSVVKYLVGEQGAQVDAKKNDGKTPLDFAGRYPEIQKFLKEWPSTEKAEEMRRDGFGKMAADVRARQRQLGSLRPKAPGL